MHATEIIGWTFNGAMYCIDHKPESIPDGADKPCPIFASDEIEPLDCCDMCLATWISENPGKNASDEKAPVFIDQDRAEEYLSVARCSETGYTPCACRDCMETAIGTKGEPIPLCHDCEESGCDDSGESECSCEPEAEILQAIFNRFTIYMPREAMEDCSHSGSCDSDVSHWAPILQKLDQNKEISPEDIRAELKEYGAWEVSELEDDSTNWDRIVWCAACNLKEEKA